MTFGIFRSAAPVGRNVVNVRLSAAESVEAAAREGTPKGRTSAMPVTNRGHREQYCT